MSQSYTCPTCGYHTAFGNSARIALHQGVPHGGATPILAVEEDDTLLFLTDH
jgi:hypothetical protein